MTGVCSASAPVPEAALGVDGESSSSPSQNSGDIGAPALGGSWGTVADPDSLPKAQFPVVTPGEPAEATAPPEAVAPRAGVVVAGTPPP